MNVNLSELSEFDCFTPDFAASSAQQLVSYVAFLNILKAIYRALFLNVKITFKAF